MTEVAHHSVAVLGGDRREHRIAALLAQAGHEVRMYGNGVPVGELEPIIAASALDAVKDAAWIVCPSPGLSAADELYAPHVDEPIVLDRELLSASAAHDGGLVLGRASATVKGVADELAIPVFEMKDDRTVALNNAGSVAEALLAIVIEATDRVLPDLRILVLGYGATGEAAADRLLALRAGVTVAARDDVARVRAQQRGAAAVGFDDRVASFGSADVVINTVPDPGAVPTEASELLRGALVVDIASPPGGMDHDALAATGVEVRWARALAGARACLSVGDYQFGFVEKAINGRSRPST